MIIRRLDWPSVADWTGDDAEIALADCAQTRLVIVRRDGLAGSKKEPLRGIACQTLKDRPSRRIEEKSMRQSPVMGRYWPPQAAPKKKSLPGGAYRQDPIGRHEDFPA